MRILILLLCSFIALSNANASSVSIEVPASIGYFERQFNIRSDHGPDLFQAQFGFSGGPSIIPGGTAPYWPGGDPNDYSTTYVSLSVGSASLTRNDCNQPDFHCSRGDQDRFGFVDSEYPTSVVYVANALGPYARMNPATIYFEIPPGFYIATVPEPSTWAMLLIGLAGIAFAAKRMKRRALPA
jgi:hypothetical protein